MFASKKSRGPVGLALLLPSGTGGLSRDFAPALSREFGRP